MIRIVFVLVLLFSSFPVLQVSNAGEILVVGDLLKTENQDKKLELIKKLHRVLPTSKIVDAMINQTAPRYAQNGVTQDAFKKSMKYIVDYEMVERLSHQSMIDIFTYDELKVLVAFYTNENGLSAARKMRKYQVGLGAEIMNEIDTALIKFRTGSKADFK